MLQSWSRPGAVVAAFIGVLTLTGCQANGGGTLPSSDPACASPTSFGFVFTITPANPNGSFNGSFVDRCAAIGAGRGVFLHGSGPMAPSPKPAQAPPTVGGCMVGLPNYTSIDPTNPGTGVLSLIVCDSANSYGLGLPTPGANAQSTVGDFISLQVVTGPDAPYSVAGFVQSGNIVIRQ